MAAMYYSQSEPVLCRPSVVIPEFSFRPRLPPALSIDEPV